jgi:hypothetical protein
MVQLHDSYVLYVSQDAYTLIGQSDKPETLTVTRATNTIDIQRE